MLYDIQGRKHEEIPHKHQFDTLRARLKDEDHALVIEEIHRRIGTCEIFNSSFIATGDWGGTPLMYAYFACNEDQELAALFYGQLCWQAIQHHPDNWIFHKIEGTSFGMTYFRKKS